MTATTTSNANGFTVNATLPNAAQLAPDQKRLFLFDVAKNVCGTVLAAAILAVGGAVVAAGVDDSAASDSGAGPDSVEPVSCVEVLHRVRVMAMTRPIEVEALLGADGQGQTLVTQEEFSACGTAGQIGDAARDALPD